MTLFDIAVQLVRSDVAMLKAGVPIEQRSKALNELAESIVKAGLDEHPTNVVPFRRPL